MPVSWPLVCHDVDSYAVQHRTGGARVQPWCVVQWTHDARLTARRRMMRTSLAVLLVLSFGAGEPSPPMRATIPLDHWPASENVLQMRSEQRWLLMQAMPPRLQPRVLRLQPLVPQHPFRMADPWEFHDASTHSSARAHAHACTHDVYIGCSACGDCLPLGPWI